MYLMLLKWYKKKICSKTDEILSTCISAYGGQAGLRT